MAAAQAYPVRVDASLDAPLSRWLWLVKWVLVIPHYIVLAFLWVAFVVLSAAAMVAIVFTGRYPRAIFEFNVGVLRWTWRVQYYAIGAFGTDRYPPFTLADDPSYPAHLEIEYPQRLSRGLALVKWWLLAIPQYIIVGVFTGSGLWAAWQFGYQRRRLGRLRADRPAGRDRRGGAAGDRAVPGADLRLRARHEPVGAAGGRLRRADDRPVPAVPAGHGRPRSRHADPAAAPGPAVQDVPEAADLRQAPPRGPGGWTGGRIVAAVAGAVLVLCSVGLLGGSGVALWAQANRHGGYADLATASYSVPGYAIASDTIGLHLATGAASDLIGTVRIQVTQASGTAPAFVGIAPAGAAARYLAGVDYATVRGAAGHHGTYTEHAGSAPAVPPGQAGIWTAHAAGPGTQTLTWAVRSGDWMVVAMNADGSRPVSLQVNVAATLPALPWIAAGLLIGGIIVLIGGVLLIVIPVRRASRR